MSWTMFRTLLLASVAMAPAAAQTVSSSSSGKVEEVVITAQKRRENPMKTAVAVTVFSANQLRQHDVTSLENLAATTPSFQVNNTGPTDNANIRGIGLAVTSPTVASGVPIYRDGLFQSPLLSTEPLYDIAGVEVLRGPQGTLVGANSTGGAVFITTNDPKIGATSGYIEGKAGSFADVGAQGAVNIPVNDVLAARIAFNYETRDSYYKNIGAPSALGLGGANSAQPGNYSHEDARLGVLYQPNSQFTALFKINFQKYDTDGLALPPIPGTPAAANYLSSEPWVLEDPDGQTTEQDTQIRPSLELKYVFANGITLRSLSGTTYTHEIYNVQQYSGAANDPEFNHIEDHVNTQEFNLLSPASNRLHWVVGTYSQYWPAAIKLSPNTTQPIYVTQHDDKIANALFGEAGYNITPSLEVHVGLRYALDHAYATGGVYGAFGGPSLTYLGSQAGNQKDSISSGRIGINYTITPDQFAYLTISKGSKTGGINGGAGNFAPEAVYDYELGIKSSWFDKTLRTTFGIYDMDYKRMQLEIVEPQAGTTPGNGVANAGAASVYGFEATFQAQHGPLGFDGNFAYNHSKISAEPEYNSYLWTAQGLSPSGLQCAAGQTANCFNYAPYLQAISGKSLPYAPEWTAAGALHYDYDLGDAGLLTPQLSIEYSSKQWTTVFENGVDLLKSRTLVGAHLSWQKGTYTVTGYVTNLNNQHYVANEYNGTQYLWGAPREYGLKINKTF